MLNFGGNEKSQKMISFLEFLILMPMPKTRLLNAILDFNLIDEEVIQNLLEI